MDRSPKGERSGERESTHLSAKLRFATSALALAVKISANRPYPSSLSPWSSCDCRQTSAEPRVYYS